MSRSTRFEFDEFESFRERLRGWDTDPVQLGAGRLRLVWEELSWDDVSISRLEVNRRIADVSTVEPGRLGLVVTFRPQIWCGLEVPAGSLIVSAPGREHRSVLDAGFRSLEINATQDLLDDTGLRVGQLDASGFPPERCVVTVAGGLLARLEALARQLHFDGDSPCGRFRAAAIRNRVLVALSRATVRCDTPGLRSMPRHALATAALTLVDEQGDGRIPVGALARSLGVTARALEYAFLSTVGVSPESYMRAHRLNRVRRDLAASPRETVTSAATRHDFHHLGRFSAQYKRLFGELPSERRRPGAQGSAATHRPATPGASKARERLA